LWICDEGTKGEKNKKAHIVRDLEMIVVVFALFNRALLA